MKEYKLTFSDSLFDFPEAILHTIWHNHIDSNGEANHYLWDAALEVQPIKKLDEPFLWATLFTKNVVFGKKKNSRREFITSVRKYLPIKEVTESSIFLPLHDSKIIEGLETSLYTTVWKKDSKPKFLQGPLKISVGTQENEKTYNLFFGSKTIKETCDPYFLKADTDEKIKISLPLSLLDNI